MFKAIFSFVAGVFVALGIITSIMFSHVLSLPEATPGNKIALIVVCMFSFGCAGLYIYEVAKQKKGGN